MNWQGCDAVGGRTKWNSVSCLPLAILTLTEKETQWQAQQKIFPTSFFQVLGWASSSGKIPPKGPAHWPNKKCHFACLAPGFLRANRATNTSCCQHLLLSPFSSQKCKSCRPKCWPFIPLIYWGANDTDICILVCCHLCHSLLQRK